MRITHFVHRYGADIGGGAEAACRMVAERLAQRGHDVHVVTSCASNYRTWANHYDPGATTINGVEVLRVPTVGERDMSKWNQLALRILRQTEAVPIELQRQFVTRQGPELADYADVVNRFSQSSDISIFHTYLYQTTTAGIAPARINGPTLLHPTAHDEDAFRLPIFDQILRQADGFFFHTPEERDLVHGRLGNSQRVEACIGLGVDTSAPVSSEEIEAFRHRFNLGPDPYFLILGRVDSAKGVLEAVQTFAGLKRIGKCNASLVVVGEQTGELTDLDGVITTGFVDESTKCAALAGAEALIIPSYAESFSLVLIEAWAMGVPAFVQGHCSVLAGQARRSAAAFTYTDITGLSSLLDRAHADRQWLRDAGELGRQYVTRHYQWDTVMDSYEDLIERTISSRR